MNNSNLPSRKDRFDAFCDKFNKYAPLVVKIVVCLAIAAVLIFSLWIKPSASNWDEDYNNNAVYQTFLIDNTSSANLIFDGAKPSLETTFTIPVGYQIFDSNNNVVYQDFSTNSNFLTVYFEADNITLRIYSNNADTARNNFNIRIIHYNNHSTAFRAYDYATNTATIFDATQGYYMLFSVLATESQYLRHPTIDGGFFDLNYNQFGNNPVNTFLTYSGAYAFYRFPQSVIDSNIQDVKDNGIELGEGLMKLQVYEQILIAKGENPDQIYDINEVLARPLEDLTNELLQIGWDSGHSAGFADGQDDILQSKTTLLDFISAMFSAPSHLINTIFDFDLFGFNVATIIRVLFTLVIAFIVTKILLKLGV